MGYRVLQVYKHKTHVDLFGMSRVILAHLLSIQGSTAIYETSGLGLAAWRNESNEHWKTKWKLGFVAGGYRIGAKMCIVKVLHDLQCARISESQGICWVLRRVYRKNPKP